MRQKTQNWIVEQNQSEVREFKLKKKWMKQQNAYCLFSFTGRDYILF